MVRRSFKLSPKLMKYAHSWLLPQDIIQISSSYDPSRRVARHGDKAIVVDVVERSKQQQNNGWMVGDLGHARISRALTPFPHDQPSAKRHHVD